MPQHATGLCASGFIYIVKTKCPKRIAEPESQQFPGEKWLKMTFFVAFSSYLSALRQSKCYYTPKIWQNSLLAHVTFQIDWNMDLVTCILCYTDFKCCLEWERPPSNAVVANHVHVSDVN